MAAVGELTRILRRIGRGGIADDDAVNGMHREVVALAEASPRRLVAAAEPLLSAGSAAERVVAVVALGRAGEFVEHEDLGALEARVLGAIRAEPDRDAAKHMASALPHIWHRRDDRMPEVEAATDPCPAIRRAAAISLCLGYEEPLTGRARQALDRLARDADPDVAQWANME